MPPQAHPYDAPALLCVLFEHGLNDTHQLCGHTRLLDESVTPSVRGSPDGRAVVMTAERNDGNGAGGPVAPHESSGLPTIETGHLEIQQDEVGDIRQRKCQGFVSIRCERDLVAGLHQKLAARSEGVQAVVHEKNQRRPPSRD
jgi:hypothetical protein